MCTRDAAGSRECADAKTWKFITARGRQSQLELDFPAVVKLTGVSDCSFLAVLAFPPRTHPGTT